MGAERSFFWLSATFPFSAEEWGQRIVDGWGSVGRLVLQQPGRPSADGYISEVPCVVWRGGIGGGWFSTEASGVATTDASLVLSCC